MSARDNILRRLRSAPKGKPILPPDINAFYAAVHSNSPQENRTQRIERFCEKMAFWRGEVVRVTHANWAKTCRDCVAKNVELATLYGSHSPHAAALEAAGMNGLKPYDRPVDEWKTELFRDTDAGFTSTRGGIAETGTLIVWPDARSPDLMYPCHQSILPSWTRTSFTIRCSMR